LFETFSSLANPPKEEKKKTVVTTMTKTLTTTKETTVINGEAAGESPVIDLETLVIRSPRKGTDNSVEKYFDNLISMIEDAAEGL
jgi:hypothetical protein